MAIQIHKDLAETPKNSLDFYFRTYYPKNETLFFSGVPLLICGLLLAFGVLIISYLPILNTGLEGFAVFLSIFSILILAPGFTMYIHGLRLLKLFGKKTSFEMTVEELKFNNYPTLSNLPTNSLTRVSLTKEIKISKGSAQIYRTNCYHFHFNQQLKQIYADEIDVSCTDFNKALVSHPVISRTLDESILNFNTLDEHDFSLQNVVLTLFLGAIFLLSFCIFLGRILYDSYLLSH